MAAAITVRSATNTVVEAETFAHVSVTGVSTNTALGVERRYYLVATKSGSDALRSYTFSPSSDGKHTWDNLLFPDDGTWTMALRDILDDSQVATLAVVVAARA